MASARRIGTNEAVSTYGTASRDFAGGTGFSTWETLTDIDHTTGHEEASIINVSATRFDVAESLSFSSSGATATCQGTNLARTKMWYTVLTGTPTTADTITGDTSTATADIDTIDNTNTGVSHVLELHKDGNPNYDDEILLGDSTNNSSFFRIIRPAAGEGHDGTPGTGVYIRTTSTAYVFEIRETNSQIQDFEADFRGSTASSRGVMRGSAGSTDHGFIAIISFDSLNGLGNSQLAFVSEGGFYILCACDLAVQTASANTEHVISTSLTAGEKVVIYNCVLLNSGTKGVNHSGVGETLCINTIANGNPTSDFDPDISASSDFNASGDDTADDANVGSNRINQTFTFVSPGSPNFDYHLAVGDAGAKNFGTDLSADADYPFDEDIDGDLFGTWDIGFDENEAAGGPGVVVSSRIMGASLGTVLIGGTIS